MVLTTEGWGQRGGETLQGESVTRTRHKFGENRRFWEQEIGTNLADLATLSVAAQFERKKK